MNIRTAVPEDAAAILNIYKPYIENTAVSFEYDPPSLEDFRERIIKTLTKYPYLVAEEEGRIVGYSYAGQFHTRRAYIYGAELSVYVDRDHRKKGIGNMLYGRIAEILKKQNVLRLYACIAVPEELCDPYLTDDSIRFHEKLGFEKTGHHERCGYKFGRWYGVTWMEKVISDRYDNPGEFIPFPELDMPTM